MEAELSAAKAQISELIKSAQQGGGDRSAQLRQAQQASRELSRIGRSATPNDPPPPPPPPSAVDLKALGVGDEVVVPRLGPAGVRVEKVQGNQLFVVFGGLKMKVRKEEVVSVQRAAESSLPPPSASKGAGRGSAGRKGGGGRGRVGGGGAGQGARADRSRPMIKMEGNTLDLRGKRPSEIDFDLGRAVDRSAGMGTLWVVHGRGTGSLKQEVRRLLAEEPMVESFEDAPFDQGGDGCTVAFLR